MQPFDGGFYASGYNYTYNQPWETKIAAPLSSKSFPWGLNPVNHLSSPVHHQTMCFGGGASNNFGSSMVPSLASQPGLGCGGGGSPASPCLYAASSAPPPPPYLPYNRDQCSSSSIASLRLKAKHHSYPVTYATAAAAALTSRPVTSSMSACQYAPVGNVLGLP